MKPFHSDDPEVAYEPRKPQPEGIKIYLWCFSTTKLNLPVCYKVFPDIRIPIYNKDEIIQTIKESWPKGKKVTICTDSYFLGFSTLNSMVDHFGAFALPHTHDSKILDLFTHDIRHHENRVFFDGKFVISIWLDRNLMITASNYFKPGENSINPSFGIDVLEIKPIISVEGVKVLEGMPLEDLKSLCHELGRHSSNKKIFSLFYLFFN